MGYKVGKKIIKRLLGKRKIAKPQTMKTVANRNEQFEKIESLQKQYVAKGYAVLSMDVKKKEYLGNFYRLGSTYGQAAQVSYDHDYNSFAKGPLVPHGIYDPRRQEGHLHLGISADTAEFATDCLKAWWLHNVQHRYSKENPILILCDGGGSNGSSNRLFKKELQKLVNELGITIKLLTSV